jgi:hypothetical protein
LKKQAASNMTSTHEMISDSEAYTNENDTFSEAVTNTTNISLTLSAAKPKSTKNKFGKFLSGMSGTLSHSKSSNDIHNHKISGSVAMSVNAASQYNILNISESTTANKSTSSILQTSNKKNKLSNSSSNNSMIVSAVRLLNSLTGVGGGGSTTSQSAALKMPKSFSSFNIKQPNGDVSSNVISKSKKNLISSMNTNGNLTVPNNSKLFIFFWYSKY